VATLLFGQAQGLAPTTKQHYFGKQQIQQINFIFFKIFIAIIKKMGIILFFNAD